MIKIGHGYDVHKLVAGRDLILGGVKIDHATGLDGHSDADVLIHACCDAIIGALGLGDIGQHFPDTDPQFAGADSRKLLRHVATLMSEQGFVLSNLDATVVAQAPKLASYLPAMREHISADLACSVQQINIKATTTEQLGFAGREEGMAAHAVVLIATTEH